jgi:MoxR-like ATPase
MATQNPIEMEGTYPLPEAQLDRFMMKILVNYPSHEELHTIVDRSIQKREPVLNPILDGAGVLEIRATCRKLEVPPAVRDFAVKFVMATQPDSEGAHEAAKKWIRYGSSPRGAQALVECGRVLALMRGRLQVSIEDIQSVCLSVLRHRVILNFDAHADGQTADGILTQVIRQLTDRATRSSSAR